VYLAAAGDGESEPTKRETQVLFGKAVDSLILSICRELRSTNPIENLNASLAAYTRDVKRWRSGSMIVHWVSAALLEAERRFRRVRGCRELPHLICALEAMELEHGVTAEKQVA
jgi:hypothetical protein